MSEHSYEKQGKRMINCGNSKCNTLLRFYQYEEHRSPNGSYIETYWRCDKCGWESVHQEEPMPRYGEITMTFKNKINIYRCETCQQKITTIDLDEGTTSMFLTCKVTPGCNGRMVSSMYQVDQSLTPDHEWYKPKKVPKGIMHDHVMRGGLLLRKKG